MRFQYRLIIVLQWVGKVGAVLSHIYKRVVAAGFGQERGLLNYMFYVTDDMMV
jgi:hypothetical protein